jgi:hypothetical protein
MIEGFFGKMTKQMLRGIRVATKQELIDRIYKYFDEVNEYRSYTIGSTKWRNSTHSLV